MLKRTLFNISLFSLVAMIFAACGGKESPGWEYMPDMYRGPAVGTYSAYDQFDDSLSARKPVTGTIPRGFMSYQKFENTPDGYERAKAEMKMPEGFPTDSLALFEGGKLYGIYCAQCHGEKGNGQGVLVKNEVYLGVPSYDTREINYGSIFHVVTYGKGVMGAHASQVTPEERWKIAQHVMKLRSELLGGGEEESKDEETSESDAAGEEKEEATETKEG